LEDYGDIPQLSVAENDLLVKDYSMEEVRDAISQMERNKSSGPDGFPAEFYQTIWDIIKFYLMALFASFQRGQLPFYKFNFGVITLLPKKENATQSQQYSQLI
jgi:hypothetical protein